MSVETADSPTLAGIVATEPPRADVVAACVELVNAEVKAKKGLGGAAIKGAYGTIKRIKPRFVSETVDALLDDWLAKMEPYHVDWRAAGSGTFEAFVTERADAVAEDLLSVTDERAEATKHKTAGKLYFKMRPKALANVATAVPKLGALLDQYL